MLSSEERKIIVDHALQNEESLSIALDIVNSFDEIRKRVIGTFLMKLEELLKSNLQNGWTIRMDIKENPFERYTGVQLSKGLWSGKYEIGFQAGKYGAKDFYIGVSKVVEKHPHIARLYEELNTNFGQGSTEPWWVWWRSLDYPYLDWDNADTLLKMFRGEAADYFYRQLLKLADLATPILDDEIPKLFPAST